MNTMPRVKDCAACGVEFLPARLMQVVCGLRCARRKVAAGKKAAKVKLKARREAIKPRAKWLAECQAIVNKIVRLRDRDLPCCSCDRPASWGGQWHASHFRSVGAAPGIRFHLWNIHKGCSICNNHLSGNIPGYRPRIIERIGCARLDWVEAQNARGKHSVDYLRRFKSVMGRRLKRMETRMEAA